MLLDPEERKGERERERERERIIKMINRGSIDSLFDSIFVMVARSALIFSQYCHNFFHAREILPPIAFIDRI